LSKQQGRALGKEN